MASHWMLGPVLAQVLLTLLMYILLAKRKAQAVQQGQVDRQQAALDNRVWPEAVRKVSNNIANQFETPVLFYVLCLSLAQLDAVSPLALGLASVFALSRYAHAYVHVTSNYVPWRMRIFMLGTVILLLLLILSAAALFAV